MASGSLALASEHSHGRPWWVAASEENRETLRAAMEDAFTGKETQVKQEEQLQVWKKKGESVLMEGGR